MSQTTPENVPSDLSAVRDHRRQWRDCVYAYPVIARRSKGLSVGINLNPNRDCNFQCLYCQISRGRRRHIREVRLEVLRSELRLVLQEALSGRLWQEPRFASTPPHLRRINDIAFSGDGEPTCLPEFDRAVKVGAEVKRELGLDEVKLVVITNASLLDAPQVRRALLVLDANNGEIWAKLDAGTEERFRLINRPPPTITLQGILDNILAVGLARAVVIQTLLFRLHGQPPPPEEIDAYVGRLRWLIGNHAQVKLIQLHTIARPPAENSAEPLTNQELDAIAETVRAALPETAVETYYGAK